jgi:hypothetical protein
MPRDLTDAYARAQAFKEQYRIAENVTGERLEELRGVIACKIAQEGITEPQAARAALYSTLNGLTWIAGLSQVHDLAIDPLMSIPEDIARNVSINAEDVVLNPSQAIQMGVGAGFFTGLLVGLDAGRWL